MGVAEAHSSGLAPKYRAAVYVAVTLDGAVVVGAADH
jgi:hypothetical protein